MRKLPKGTIKINDDWYVRRDEVCWILYRRNIGISPRTKKQSITFSTTFHATFMQICKYILDISLGKASDVEEMKKILEKTQQQIRDFIIKHQKDMLRHEDTMHRRLPPAI